MTAYRELLIGCGSRRTKDTRIPSAAIIRRHLANPDERLVQVPGSYEFQSLTTLDINSDHKPDIIFNLERIDGETHNRIPNHNTQNERVISTGVCPDDYYDEIHAYEVLEHIGRQGDYRKFFDQFAEFARVLKPGGFLFATVPSWRSEWLWADPSHTRVITQGTLSFLSQAEYKKQVGKTAMSDFRWYYKADFQAIFSHDDGESFIFALRVIK